jgi:hypothetical protein
MRFPLLLAAVGGGVALAAPSKPLEFTVTSLSVDGGVHAVDTADLDGDGRLDLVAVVVNEKSPERSLAVFWNRAAGFAPKPDLVFPVPEDVCAYDFAPIDVPSREELLEVLPTGVRARSFAERVPAPPRMLVTEPTLFLHASKHALPRLRLFEAAKASGPELMLLPGQSELFVFGREGQDFVRRAALPVEVETQISLPARNEGALEGLPTVSVTAHFPQVTVIDFDGDGLRDIALIDGQRVHGFLQGAEGFSEHSTFEHTFEVRSAAEKTAGVKAGLKLVDADGDGRADAIITKEVSKGITSAKTTVCVLYGTPKGFPAKPDQVIDSDGVTMAGVQRADVTGDGLSDLVVPSVQVGIFSIIRMLTSSSVKVGFQLYPMGAKKRSTRRPRPRVISSSGSISRRTAATTR